MDINKMVIHEANYLVLWMSDFQRDNKNPFEILEREVKDLRKFLAKLDNSEVDKVILEIYLLVLNKWSKVSKYIY